MQTTARGKAPTRAVPSGRKSCLTVLLVTTAVALAARAGAAGGEAPSVAGTFVVETNPYVLGQAVTWLDRQHVIWHGPVAADLGGGGEIQLYRSTLDGADQVCLTCGLPGPNQVPVAQAHGRWILFHSWNGHSVRVGSPGFGGLGSDVWVMTRDGQHRTNLTNSSELHDNFHAYWSPDGAYIAWTALNWNAAEGGTGKSEIRVARFDPHGPNGPRLVGEHVVRPGNGHWYETQWWAPDGSGLLYTETVDTAINPELFFCRLPDPADGVCHPVRLTHDPAWDEQAIFTPDMSRIIFMSSRNLPGAQNDWAQVATLLDLPAEYDFVLILPEFNTSYLQPVFQQATDLYEITLRWSAGRTRFKPGPVRRLTHVGEEGWVVPEFAWDPGGRRLLWTQSRFGNGRRVDQACVMRQLRTAIIGQLSGVRTIDQIVPVLTLPTQIRAQAAGLLQDPTSYAVQDTSCGGGDPNQQPTREEQTLIGHFEGGPAHP